MKALLYHTNYSAYWLYMYIYILYSSASSNQGEKDILLNGIVE